jgi:hypothetical protein
MVDQQVQEITRELMGLNRVIGELKATVAALTTTWDHNDREATAGRGKLHAKLDEVKGEVIKLTARVDHMAGEVATMKPSVETFDQQHQQNIGSKKTMAAIWGALFMLAGTAGAIAVKLLELFWPPKH